MIAALDPLEFVPNGRKIVKEHCGPLNKKSESVSNEFILLDRLKNVNISAVEHHNESWKIREFYRSDIKNDFQFLAAPIANSEEELYFSGHTVVWSRGRDNTSSEICYTTESPVQFAFFCSQNFLYPDYKIQKCPPNKSNESLEHQGIGIIDSSSLKVYSKNGENLITAIESPIRRIWITKYCILIEKDASTDMVEGHVLPMPRVFSLTHALDDMFPILLKVQLLVSYITEDEYKVINFFPGIL